MTNNVTDPVWCSTKECDKKQCARHKMYWMYGGAYMPFDNSKAKCEGYLPICNMSKADRDKYNVSIQKMKLYK